MQTGNMQKERHGAKYHTVTNIFAENFLKIMEGKQANVLFHETETADCFKEPQNISILYRNHNLLQKVALKTLGTPMLLDWKTQQIKMEITALHFQAICMEEVQKKHLTETEGIRAMFTFTIL